LYPAAPEQVYGAAEAVLRDLDLMLVESGQTASGGYRVVARNPQDTRVIVTVESAGIESTRAAVRVQPGWNEGLSVRILQMIDERLRGVPR
jgi:hypothetical protein